MGDVDVLPFGGCREGEVGSVAKPTAVRSLQVPPDRPRHQRVSWLSPSLPSDQAPACLGAAPARRPVGDVEAREQPVGPAMPSTRSTARRRKMPTSVTSAIARRCPPRRRRRSPGCRSRPRSLVATGARAVVGRESPAGPLIAPVDRVTLIFTGRIRPTGSGLADVDVAEERTRLRVVGHESSLSENVAGSASAS